MLDKINAVLFMLFSAELITWIIVLQRAILTVITQPRSDINEERMENKTIISNFWNRFLFENLAIATVATGLLLIFLQ
jgi:hypothetical protein